jgi:hypothetical protein
MTQTVHSQPWGAPPPVPPKRPTPWVPILLAAIGASLLLTTVVDAPATTTTAAADPAATTQTTLAPDFSDIPADVADPEPIDDVADPELVAADAGRVADDLETIAYAARSYDLTGVHSGCYDLADDVDTAQERDLSAIPSDIADAYIEALEHFENAAALCTTGGVDGLNSASDEIAAGTAAIEEANVILEG